MLWVAAFLALIIWVLGLASNFLGFRIHLFLLFAIFCGLIALLPSRVPPEDEENTEDDRPVDPNANFMPAEGDGIAPTRRDPTASE
jgi:uncharacterized protein (DUF58 family)